jgi:hypothetical protein
VHRVAVVDEQPGSREPGPQLRADEVVEPSAQDGNGEQEEPQQYGQLVRVAEPAEVGRQLRRACEELVTGCEPFLDPRRRVAGDPQQPSELGGGFRALRARRVRPRRQRDRANGLRRGARFASR